MCGILGLIGNGGECKPAIEAGLVACRHRGPDAVSIWNHENVWFGHLRLSIIDLAARSNQPFVKDGLVIIFNGEIYNYRELRSRLSGVNFRTESDTEVVLEAWRKWGIDALSFFRGMFAFAIYDEITGDTVVARDHFGIKPLFYKNSEGMFMFSSELKGIEAMSSQSLQVSRPALLASMLYVWVPEEQCVWEGVKKLPPGGYLRISKHGNIILERFWSATDLLKSPVVFDNEINAIEYLNHILESSVKAHLAADVPINAFLSGGLDSSLIVAMARKHLNSLDCYTINFTDDDLTRHGTENDAYYADKVAKNLGVRLNTIEIRPDLASLLPKIVHHLDEPIGDSAAINTFLICQGARQQGVKVLLSGMGADELFGGYRKHFANIVAGKYRSYLPSSLRKAISQGLAHVPLSLSQSDWPMMRWAKRFSAFASLPEADAFLRSYTYFSKEELLNSFSSDVSSDLDDLFQRHHETFAEARSRGLIDAMCYTDVCRFMTSLNLTYTDRASMAASTEVRVPYIDIEVTKFAFSIPESMKIKGMTQKYLLKKVAERWLPKEIVYRPKASFTMPLRAWIKRDLGDMVNEYLLSTQGLSSRGLLKPEFIRRLVEYDKAGREDNSQIIWHMLTLEQWFRNHKA